MASSINKEDLRVDEDEEEVYNVVSEKLREKGKVAAAPFEDDKELIE